MATLNLSIKRATIEDYPKLYNFYDAVYPDLHPLKNIDFWKWQYADPEYGTSYIVQNDEEVLGHVGAYFNGGVAWIINVYLKVSARGHGFLRQLYNMAREDYINLGATSANDAGLGLYRNMKWYRYSNLERLICFNPAFDHSDILSILKPIPSHALASPQDNIYWKQPGIHGHMLRDGSTGISQFDIGGFRIVDIKNMEQATSELWSLGYKWIDYVTSWNDLNIRLLAKNEWISDDQAKLPWYLNPIDQTKKFRVSFLSENPLQRDFVCNRKFSDHGRVGKLPNKKHSDS
ncbi:MAG: GNAT family N-acetyltransferase [Bacteroidota bacterium]